MPQSNSITTRLKLCGRSFTEISYPRDLPLIYHAFTNRHTHRLPTEVWSVVGLTHGYLSEREAGFLYWAARNWPVEGPIIELGSLEGRSTLVFALGGRCVHAVDAWSSDVGDISALRKQRTPEESYARFKHNLENAGVASMVVTHRGRTDTIGMSWHTIAAILYIDAGHGYEDISRDLVVWLPHLHRHGLLLMHDVLGHGYRGVTRAASELLRHGWRVVGSAGSLVAFTRSAENAVADQEGMV